MSGTVTADPVQWLELVALQKEKTLFGVKRFPDSVGVKGDNVAHLSELKVILTISEQAKGQEDHPF